MLCNPMKNEFIWKIAPLPAIEQVERVSGSSKSLDATNESGLEFSMNSIYTTAVSNSL